VILYATAHCCTGAPEFHLQVGLSSRPSLPPICPDLESGPDLSSSFLIFPISRPLLGTYTVYTYCGYHRSGSGSLGLLNTTVHAPAPSSLSSDDHAHADDHCRFGICPYLALNSSVPPIRECSTLVSSALPRNLVHTLVQFVPLPPCLEHFLPEVTKRRRCRCCYHHHHQLRRARRRRSLIFHPFN
jgi:hypothetical protein